MDNSTIKMLTWPLCTQDACSVVHVNIDELFKAIRCVYRAKFEI